MNYYFLFIQGEMELPDVPAEELPEVPEKEPGWFSLTLQYRPPVFNI